MVISIKVIHGQHLKKIIESALDNYLMDYLLILFEMNMRHTSKEHPRGIKMCGYFLGNEVWPNIQPTQEGIPTRIK